MSKTVETEFMEEDNPDKACISCDHFLYNSDDQGGYNFCDIDNHYIGYVDAWTVTCKHHRKDTRWEKNCQS